MTRRPDDTADIVRRLAALDITRTPLYRHVTTAALFLEAHGVEPAVAEAVARRVPMSLIDPLIKQLARGGPRCKGCPDEHAGRDALELRDATSDA